MSDTNLVNVRLQERAASILRLSREQRDNIAAAADAIGARLLAGGKLLAFGNGGSAAAAQHLAAEFVGRFSLERPPIAAVALSSDTSLITAIGNDFGFDQVFSRQIAAIGRRDDVAIALSTSGESANVLHAVRTANDTGMVTIGLIGGGGGPLARLVRIPIVAPSFNTAQVQECHLIVSHLLCEMVESQIVASLVGRDALAGGAPAGPATSPDAKIIDIGQALALRSTWSERRQVVVWTNGCFDLLHEGHIRSLQLARSHGDLLIVGLNSDDSVRTLKGPGRPIVTAESRARALAGLGCVDYVIIYDDLTPVGILSQVKPDIVCKGEEYAPGSGKPIPELETVHAYGGKMRFLPMIPGISSSELVRRIRNGQSPTDDLAVPAG